MSYTGSVKPGAVPQFRGLPQLTIGKLSVGEMDNNAYLLRCRTTGQALLIDAAAEPARLIDMVNTTPQTELIAVLTTHRHPDHWRALAEVVQRTGVRTIAHPADADAIPVPTQELVDDGATLHIGGIELTVIHLVGHTPGSIAVLYRDPVGAPHLFTGDSLFPGGVGNTHGNPENFRSLMNDIEAKIFDQLPDATWVYPGHGDDTTLGAERPHLAEWRARGW